MTATDIPAINPCFRVRVIDPDVVFLISQYENRLLRGALYRKIVALIDGRRTTGAIVEALAPDHSPAEVHYALEVLRQKRYVVDPAVIGDPDTIASSLPPARLDGVLVHVVGIDGLQVDAVTDALSALGAGIDAAAALTLVCTPDYLAPGVRAYAAASQSDRRTWMLVAPTGPEIWIGPLVRPGSTACWECLAQRLRQHRAVDTYLESIGLIDERPMPPGITRRNAVLVAHEIGRALTGSADGSLENTVCTFDPRTGVSQRHHVVHRPNCPACGVPLSTERMPAPVTLQSRPKRFIADGGHRTATPEETYARFHHHVSPVTGAVNVLAARSVESSGTLHVYTSGRNLAYKARSLEGLLGNSRTGSSGKGMTAAQARTSGLCEALERYSAVFEGDEPRIRASYDAMQHRAIHPADCMLISSAQYAHRIEWNARNPPANRIPEPFDDTASVEWTPVWSLTHNIVKYLPAALCYLGYPHAPDEPRTCVPTSSGNAAGNTIEEACLQAILELMERDAVALWWYNRAQRPAVALETFEDSEVDRLRGVYAGLGRDLWVLDVSGDLGVPTFAAISRHREAPDGAHIFGFGAHLDARVALRRALSEVNQALAGSLAHPHSINRHLQHERYLVPDDSAPLRTFSDFPSLATPDVRDDVAWCQRALEQRGLELLVLDLTRPDIGLPVVKVIVPGLRPYVPRFAAGRLFDVPVQLGWIPERLTESQLNPIPMVP